jgi:hypothetical protein
MAESAAKNARAGMAIAADAPPLAPAEPVIDRAHLARVTQGERDLEREVLQLYATQADILLARRAITACRCRCAGAYSERVVARDWSVAGRRRRGST